MTSLAQGVATRTGIWGLIGAAGVISALQVGVGTPLAPGAGMFPLIVSLVILVMALADAVVMGRGRDLGHGEDAANSHQRGKRVLVVLVVLAYAVLLPLLGALVTMMLTTFVLMFVIERLPLRLSALVTVGTGIGLFVIFHVLLDVPLPAGVVWTSMGVA